MNLIGDINFLNSIQDFGASSELAGAVDVVVQQINGTAFVYVSGNTDDGIQVLSLAQDGTLTPVSSIANSSGLGLDGVGSLSTVQIGNDYFLIAGGSRSDALTTFRIDDDGTGTDGQLIPVETYFNAPSPGEPTDGQGLLDFAYYTVIANVGGTQFVIAAAYNSDALSVYRIEANGELTLTDSALDSDDITYRLDALDGLAVHEVGGNTFVFTGSEGSDDGISVFQLSATGQLTSVFTSPIGGTGSDYNSAELEIIDFNGKTYAVFINRTTDRILTYEVDSNGQLEFRSETDQFIDGNYSNMFSTGSFTVDGVPFLLMTAIDQSTILVLSIDDSGKIEIVQTIQDQIELNGVRDMTVQTMGDRTFLLATSFDNGSIGVFEIGAGNDVLVGTAEDDRIVGMLGDDDLIGRQGDDELFGGLGNDVLSGRRGNDDLDGGGGEDVLVGGRGDDTLEGGGGADIIKGGRGFDTISYASSGGAVTIDLLAGTVSGGDGAGDIFVQIEGVIGSAGNDRITGNAQANTLSGLGGRDNIRGGDGKDKLLGGAGRDQLRGEAGRDILNGGTGNDTLFGGAGNDRLIGGGGKDRLSGQAGNDKLTGNAGADVFIFANNLGSDEITDFKVGTDRIDLSGVSSINNMSDLNAAASTLGGNTLISVDGGPDLITLLGVTENQLGASDFIFV